MRPTVGSKGSCADPPPGRKVLRPRLTMTGTVSSESVVLQIVRLTARAELARSR